MNTHIINSNKHGRLKYSFLEILRIIWKNPRQVDWSWSWLPFTNMDIHYFYSFFTDTNFRYHGSLLNKKIIQLINFSLHSSKISIYIKTKKHFLIENSRFSQYDQFFGNFDWWREDVQFSMSIVSSLVISWNK